MKIGVLSLQGDFAEHIAMMDRIGVDSQEVRLPEHLEGLDGLVIPGGESTTISKLANDFGLLEPLRQFGRQKAVWGTCAGAILMSKDVQRKQSLLGLMDIRVERNAFGRQIKSFETDLNVPVLEEVGPKGIPYHGVFIRAPLIESVHGRALVLAQLPDGRIVAAQEGHMLATSFHPELTPDDRFHKYFLSLVG